jgi:hypothetical protein
LPLASKARIVSAHNTKHISSFIKTYFIEKILFLLLSIKDYKSPLHPFRTSTRHRERHGVFLINLNFYNRIIHIRNHESKTNLCFSEIKFWIDTEKLLINYNCIFNARNPKPWKTPPFEPVSTKPADVEPEPEEHQRMRIAQHSLHWFYREHHHTVRTGSSNETARRELIAIGLRRFPNQAGTGPHLLCLSLPSSNFKWIGQWKMDEQHPSPTWHRVPQTIHTAKKTPYPANKLEQASAAFSAQEEEHDERQRTRQQHRLMIHPPFRTKLHIKLTARVGTNMHA